MKQQHSPFEIIAILLAACFFALALVTSCSQEKRATRFKKKHPYGMWTLKGYVRPKPDSVIHLNETDSIIIIKIKNE